VHRVVDEPRVAPHGDALAGGGEVVEGGGGVPLGEGEAGVPEVGVGLVSQNTYFVNLPQS
jgi:hypothetical protein